MIINNIFADSGNAADGGEAINVKAGCKIDVANNIIYNACTNAFKLSNAGNSEVIPLTEMTAYNNTIINCGWRRSKTKGWFCLGREGSEASLREQPHLRFPFRTEADKEGWC